MRTLQIVLFLIIAAGGSVVGLRLLHDEPASEPPADLPSPPSAFNDSSGSSAPQPAQPAPTGTPSTAPPASPNSPPSGDTRTNTLNMKFVYVPAGDFMMGTPNGVAGRRGDEEHHKVVLTRGFYIGTTEVTQAQWKSIMGDEPSKFHGDDARPVDNVNWSDAINFCKKLAEKDGKKYRLPTEAEWEFACRAGSRDSYPGGDAKSVDAMAWHVRNADKSTHPVGARKPNAWGLYDMQGNVAEWCSDRYAKYKPGENTDPRDDDTADKRTGRVVRGGSWRTAADQMRSADRGSEHPNNKRDYLGFRVVMEP